ncbi:hypothetical protein G6L37_33210 [Agrobacterium rubi]|uniref:Uncharacterized protein n=1 Tax=Agrobacterium rubi TR3 = NBRC 13261 TaxID=1368415 RepID=A0A081D131_9HYPH|nr:hypothetical protein [Agrobacterium rubi]MBP1880456.1 hypothetical protein [Agrobacterium rubi]NTF10833.1 hypothetical protein [Agrobacterium rubi]NTF23249.1 hypothetical protein [Agrobacterium rubi]NTF30169.1 hypothetical protein [Agrobacterium rubi]GAK72627.1 hypothetical protein RRU01S_27_00150 [Agrobacterium rubi TR3 = NBRC 13261]
MSDMPDRTKFTPHMLLGDAEVWKKLIALAAMIDIEPGSGALIVRNGKSVLTLRPDGHVSVRGVRISQTAERDIALDAATINLN